MCYKKISRLGEMVRFIGCPKNRAQKKPLVRRGEEEKHYGYLLYIIFLGWRYRIFILIMVF